MAKQTSNKVKVYAAEDILIRPDQFPDSETGELAFAKVARRYGKTLKDVSESGDLVIISRGTMGEVSSVDARERCATGAWLMNKPGTVVDPKTAQQSANRSFKLTNIPGISKVTADKFISADFGNLDQLWGATVDNLITIDGVGTKYAQMVLLYIEQHYPDPNAAPADPGDVAGDDDPQADEGGA
jgi:hypothetical protein